MKFKNVVIESMAYHLPENKIQTVDLENRLLPLYEMLKVSIGRLELMTGVKEIRTWPIGTPPSSLSAAAGKICLDKSGVDPSKIDLLIHASVCRDFLEPASASIVHQKLNINPHAMIFDLSNACLGVMNAMAVAAQMIENGTIKRALIVSGENSEPLIEETLKVLQQKISADHKLNISRDELKKFLKINMANLTIGSAATAILLASKELAPHAPAILGGSTLTDSAASHLCQGSGSPHGLFMETHSEELMQLGIKLGVANWEKCKNTLGWKNEDVDFVITHQVGRAHEELSLASFGLKETATYRTYPYLGNTGSSALPVTLMKADENKLIKDGSNLALLGIGSGLVTLMLGIKWKNQ